MPIVLDEATRAEYLAQTLASSRASLVVSALTGTVVVEVYDGANVLRASGTMASPWATASGSTITIGEVNASGLLVSSGGAPNSLWYCQFRGANGRFVRGTFGVSADTADFKWSLSSFQTGSKGTLGTVTLTATGTALPVVLTSPIITGTPQVGQPLSLSTGTWSSESTLSYARQWLRNGSAISGANGTTYTPVSTDSGASIGGTVTATNSSGSTAASASVVGPVVAAGAATPVTSSTIRYVGSFAVEAGSGPDGQQTKFGGRGMAYNQAGNGGAGSIFLSCHISTGDMYSAEVRIPTLVDLVASPGASLNTGTLVQRGQVAAFNETDVPGDGSILVSHLVYDGKLVVTGMKNYAAGGSIPTKTHVLRSSTNLTSSTLEQKRLANAASPYDYPRAYNGYMCHVPSEWQSSLGGPCLTGAVAESIVSSASDGPSAAVFDPASMASGDITVTPLVTYCPGDTRFLGTGDPASLPGAPFADGGDLWNWTGTVAGMCIPNGTRSLLFVGNLGISDTYYAYGTPTSNVALHGTSNGAGQIYVYDPGGFGGNGEHSYPYRFQMWAYDINDLVDAKNGANGKSPHTLTPTYWGFDVPGVSTPGAYKQLMGACYDPTRRRIYVSIWTGNYADVVIHAYEVTNAVAT